MFSLTKRPSLLGYRRPQVRGDRVPRRRRDLPALRGPNQAWNALGQRDDALQERRDLHGTGL